MREETVRGGAFTLTTINGLTHCRPSTFSAKGKEKRKGGGRAVAARPRSFCCITAWSIRVWPSGNKWHEEKEGKEKRKGQWTSPGLNYTYDIFQAPIRRRRKRKGGRQSDRALKHKSSSVVNGVMKRRATTAKSFVRSSALEKTQAGKGEKRRTKNRRANVFVNCPYLSPPTASVKKRKKKRKRGGEEKRAHPPCGLHHRAFRESDWRVDKIKWEKERESSFRSAMWRFAGLTPGGEEKKKRGGGEGGGGEVRACRIAIAGFGLLVAGAEKRKKGPGMESRSKVATAEHPAAGSFKGRWPSTYSTPTKKRGGKGRWTKEM